MTEIFRIVAKASTLKTVLWERRQSGNAESSFGHPVGHSDLDYCSSKCGIGNRILIPWNLLEIENSRPQLKHAESETDFTKSPRCFEV